MTIKTLGIPMFLWAVASTAQAAPQWCGKLKEDRGSNQVKTATSPDSAPQHALFAILQGICYPEDDAVSQQPALEAARQTWMKRLLLTEADWASDLVEWGNLPYAQRMQTPDPTPNDEAPWSKAGPIEQFGLLTNRVGGGRDFRIQDGAAHYMADAFALTETGRLGYVHRCVTMSRWEDEIHPAEWATCQPDIDALDWAKIGAELRGETGRTMNDRMSVRFAAHKVQELLPTHAARVKKLVDKDDAYAKLFDIAKGARKSWAEHAGERTELLAAVSAMDDARATQSRKAAQGCSDRIWPLYAKAIGKIPAKRFENIHGDRSNAVTFLDAAVGAVLQDPDAYLAANALVTCEGTFDWLTERLRNGLQFWAGYRGPRTASLTAFRLANLQLDQRDAKLEIPTTRLTLEIEPRSRPMLPSGEGIVASVTPQGDSVLVTFVHTSEMQDHCMATRRTNRISRIDSSGNLVYETTCTKWVRERTDTTVKPVSIPKRYAGGIKPKLYVSIIGGSVEGVWVKTNSPTPVAAFGVALK
jgi:hypothetical protein